MREIGSDEARTRWRDLLDEIHADPGEAIAVLRHGKRVAVVVSPAWHEGAAGMDVLARTGMDRWIAMRQYLEATARQAWFDAGSADGGKAATLKSAAAACEAALSEMDRLEAAQ